MNNYVLHKEKSIETFSSIALIMLFPMSFIYHSFVALTPMPAFLGGYFSFMCAILLIAYLSIIFFVKSSLNKDQAIIFIVIILWFVFITYHFVFSYDNLDLYLWGITAVLSNTICFLIGSNINLSSEKLNKYLMVSFLIISLIVFSNINNGQFYLRLKSESEGVASYQSFGLYLLVVSIILLITAKSMWLKSLVGFTSVLLLYFNGARSEFVFFLFSFLFLAILQLRIHLVKSFLLLSFIAIGLLLYYWLGFSFELEDNRVLQLYSISDSTSYIARDFLNDSAIEVIKNNIILGDYGSYVKEHGIGGYAHNILSAWADFGIFIFIVLILLPTYTLFFSGIRIIHKKSYSPYLLALFSFSIILLIAYLFAKNYAYMFLGFVIGFYINPRLEGSNYESSAFNLSSF